MLLNAYDTIVGKTIAVSEQIKGSIKTLALMDDLIRSPKKGVYFVDHENGNRLPLFMFPLSVQSHDRSFITVLDRRPFTNKKGDIINHAEYTQALTTAFLQQDLQERSFSTINACRDVATRGYARALSNRIGRQAGFDDQEQIELMVFLGAFFIYQTEDQSSDFIFVAQNILRRALNLDRSVTFALLEEMGWINNLTQFVDFIKNRDSFFKIKGLTVRDFIAMGSTIWFSSLSRHIMGAALEHPPTFIGICYATATNKMYQKTTLGSQLDPKYNDDILTAFIRTVNVAYPLGNN